MSILNVEKLSHGFGDRAIFNDVSFRLLKGEHIGLIGANGEGKSTFMSIVTGKLKPDEGKVEWAKNVRVGYLDQHAELKKGMSIKDVLKQAFDFLFEMEANMNSMYEQMADADESQIETLMEEVGTIQDLLMAHDFYTIDAKIDEIARAFNLDELGLDKDVTQLSGGQRTRICMAKLLLEKPDILLLDEPTNYLDEHHIEWLRRYLQEYENAFVLISHDMEFLDSVINIIYHMENQKLDRYVGSYQKFLEVYEMKKNLIYRWEKYHRDYASDIREEDFKLMDEIKAFLGRDGLILGVCNGFQALVKSGLLPYGEIGNVHENSPTLTFNKIGRHISQLVKTKIVTNNSPWLSSFEIGETFDIPVSHGEGRFYASDEVLKELFENGQIATQYVDFDLNATSEFRFNPNGSSLAIEGIISPDGKIFGKMGHSERYSRDAFKNIPGNKDQNLILNGIKYFK